MQGGIGVRPLFKLENTMENHFCDNVMLSWRNITKYNLFMLDAEKKQMAETLISNALYTKLPS